MGALQLVLALCAVVFVLLTPGCAGGTTDQPLFINPPNGTLDVSRLPAITVAASRGSAGDVRLYDGWGRQIPLDAPRGDTLLLLPEARLEPAEDYFLEVERPDGRTVASHFRTGGLKSSFCVARTAAGAERFLGSGPWDSSCDEQYFRDGVRTDVLGCACELTASVQHGRANGLCTCAGEAAARAGDPDLVTVTSVTPVAGDVVRLPAPATIEVQFSADLAPNVAAYQLRVEASERGGRPAPVGAPVPLVALYDSAAHVARLRLGPGPPTLPDGTVLTAGRAYTAAVELVGSPPTSGPHLAGATPHAFRSSFLLVDSAGTGLSSGPPTFSPVADPALDLSVAAHLPPSAEVRLQFDGFVPDATLAALARSFRLARWDGAEVAPVGIWVEPSFERIHVRAYHPLDPRTRYEVLCSEIVAAGFRALCPEGPFGRFLTSGPPPLELADLVSSARREDFERAADVALLPGGPGVLNLPYGYKERWATDKEGPTHAIGDVLLAPPPLGKPTHTLGVDPHDPACTSLGLTGARTAAWKLASDACVTDSDCPTGWTCDDCEAGAPSGCPDEERRCTIDEIAYGEAAEAWCAEVLAGRPACRLSDTFVCIGGQARWGTREYLHNRLPSGHGCPAAYADIEGNCYPTGTVRIELALGDHDGSGYLYAENSAAGGTLQGVGSTVEITSKSDQGAANLLLDLDVTAGVDDEADDFCRYNFGATAAMECAAQGRVCDLALQCQPVSDDRAACADATDCVEGFTCADVYSSDGQPARMCIAERDGTHFSAAVSGVVPGGRWFTPASSAGVQMLWLPGHHATSTSSASADGLATFVRYQRTATSPWERGRVLPFGPNYTACLGDTDPSCAVQECERWMTLGGGVADAVSLYRAQVADVLSRLAAARDPVDPTAPYFLFLPGFATEPTDGICAAETEGVAANDFRPVTTTVHDGSVAGGPIGLAVRAEAGWPAQIRIARGDTPLTIDGPDTIDITRVRLLGGASGPVLDAHRWQRLDGVEVFGEGEGVYLGYRRGARTVIQDSILHYASLVYGSTGQEAPLTLVNNLLALPMGKLVNLTVPPRTDEPAVCKVGGPDCVAPSCRVDADCRIPRLQDRVPGACQAGQCAVGTRDGSLLTDNVVLGGSGLNASGAWNLRIQRNFHAGQASQEYLDLLDSAWVWLVDNLATGLDSVVDPVKLTNVDQVFLDGNLFHSARRPIFWVSRPGDVRLPGAAAKLVGISSSDTVHMTNNLVLDRPGGMHLGVRGAIVLDSTTGVRVSQNTVLGQMWPPVYSYDADAPSSGTIRANLVLGTTLPDNSVMGEPGTFTYDIAFSDVTCANASLYQAPGVPCAGGPLPAVDLERDDVRYLFREALPASGDIDYELFGTRQRDDLELLLLERLDHADYDPALYQDGLRYRDPATAPCGHGVVEVHGC